MKKWTKLNLVKDLIEQMEDLKDDPDREKFCVDFDAAHKRYKQRYFELTGNKWGHVN